MRCELTADPATFAEWAHDFLDADPFRCGVIITNVDARRRGSVTDPARPTFAVVRTGDRVVGAAMRTPPHPIFLAPLPTAAVEPLADTLVDACPDAAGVFGPESEAASFASRWRDRTGAQLTVAMRQRVFRLDAVIEPPPVEGLWRLAGEADRDLLLEWEIAFKSEAEGDPPPPEESGRSTWVERLAEVVDHRIRAQLAYVWVVDDVPVSLVAANVPAAGVVRIGPVYTPPEQRRKGYASALVAAVSQRALDAGAIACSLYTDVANPTSNKIYRAVGYRPIGDYVRYRFARTS